MVKTTCPWCNSEDNKLTMHSHGWGVDKNFVIPINHVSVGNGTYCLICKNCGKNFMHIVQLYMPKTENITSEILKTKMKSMSKIIK